MRIPSLREAAIRQHTTSQSLDRGETYDWDGAVMGCKRRSKAASTSPIACGARWTKAATVVFRASPGMTADQRVPELAGERCLARAQKAYHAAGREADWQAYLAEIRDRHSRKYKLVRMAGAQLAATCRSS